MFVLFHLASGSVKTSAGSSSHSKKPVSRQLSSSGSKNTNTKSKNDSSTRELSKAKESSAASAKVNEKLSSNLKKNFFPISKKRRDTSSSTGSTSTTKKTKLNSIYIYTFELILHTNYFLF